MAQQNAMKTLYAAVGDARKLYIKSTDINNKFQNAISTFDTALTNTARGNIKYAVNNLSASVGHGHANFGTVSKYVEQLPFGMRDWVTNGSYGFISGITRPFLMANTHIYIPKSDTEFNNMVNYVMYEVAKDILNLEADLTGEGADRVTTVENRATARTTSQTTFVSNVNTNHNAAY